MTTKSTTWLKMKTISLLTLGIATLLSVGCVSQKELQYKTISFSDTNGVTTIYYPLSMEKDMAHPHKDVRWKYVASKNASDDGKAKVMTVKP